jgi:tRNA G18 (ribose-2'-O)-methylase SpoU
MTTLIGLAYPKTDPELRTERRRAPDHITDLITVAMLWPKRHQNVGTMVRTCDAIGSRIILPRTVDARFAAQVGNTVGHIPHYCVFIDDPWLYLDWAASTTRLVGVELAHGSIPLAELAPSTTPTTLLLGHEVTGIPKVAIAACHEVVEIPMSGMGNSLNVSVAGSLVAYKLKGWV